MLVLQWPVCKITTCEPTVRGSATLEAFISSPTSPPFMNDFDSLDVFSRHLEQPSAWQMMEITSNEEVWESKRGVALKHGLVKGTVKISHLKTPSHH